MSDYEEGCPCGAPMRWDPDKVGMTCGGLELVGWLVCDACGVAMLVKGRSRPTEGAWKLAKGGRSLDAGGARIRVEGSGVDVPALMARLQRLPELEREVARLRAAVGDVVRIYDETTECPEDTAVAMAAAARAALR